jgi:hypothetical protein
MGARRLELARQGPHLGPERVLAAAAGAVDPPHLASRLPLGERVQHRQDRCRADAGADERDGPARLFAEHELPAGAGELNRGADVERRVQVAAHGAAGLPFDADAQPVRRGRP